MEDDSSEEVLSETEIDVCSIDVEDFEGEGGSVAPAYNSTFFSKDMGKINGLRKDSCSSPDADSGIDEKVTLADKVSKDTVSVRNAKVKNGRKSVTPDTNTSQGSDFLTDHDYPVKKEDVGSASAVARNDQQCNVVSEVPTVAKVIDAVMCQNSSLDSPMEVDKILDTPSSDLSNGGEGKIVATTSPKEFEKCSKPRVNSPSVKREHQISLNTDDDCSDEIYRKRYRHGRKRERIPNFEEDMIEGKDSDEEIDCKAEPDPLNRFYFESDHLALKHNRDYQRLLKTLVVLEGQRGQSLRDLEQLEKLKDEATENPIEFVEKFRDPGKMNFPVRQTIAKIPSVDWGRHLAHCTGNKVHYDMYVGTRGSLSKFNHEGTEHSEYEYLGKAPKSSNDTMSEAELSGSKFVRGRLYLDSKPATFNQLWTTEEQEKLEKLLHVYPPEEVESRRWEKIARALGNRTPKQVASRVQKYFIKLAKAGLPVPGRPPTLQRKSKVNPISFRNSTFFPSWRPIVNMPEDDDESMFDGTEYDPSESMSQISDQLSDDEDIPSHLKDSEEYKEYVRLVKLKRERECEIYKSLDTVHQGFKCDMCGMEPIVGTRWHCLDCSFKDLDLCNNCVGRSVESKRHTPEHNMKAIRQADSTFIDGDYVKLSGHKGTYNYLDPNFGPVNAI